MDERVRRMDERVRRIRGGRSIEEVRRRDERMFK